MAPIHTLISLACLIANNGAIESGALDSQLSVNQKQQVAQVVESGACLPENLEKLLNQTKALGHDKSSHFVSSPPDACFM